MNIISHYINVLNFGLVNLASGKRPADDNWQNTPITDPARLSGNIGLHHRFSQTATLDLDHELAGSALAAVGIDLAALLESAPFAIIGNPQKSPKALYRLPAGAELTTKKLTWPDEERKRSITIFELRGGQGFQDVLPPSIHPDTGRPYEWAGGLIPQRREDIPELPSELLMLWQNWDVMLPKLKAACPWSKPAEPKPARRESIPQNELDKARRALERLDPWRADDYDEWIAVGMALQELGADGLALWDSWSQSSNKYRPGACERKWTSFKRNGIGLGTLYHRANEDNPVIYERPPANGNGRHPEQAEPGEIDPGGEQPESQPARRHNLTDLGNARRLVDNFGFDIRFVPAWGKWFMWDGTRWAEDETGTVERLAKKVPLVIYEEGLNETDERRQKVMRWGASSENSGKIQAMISLAQTEPGIPIRHQDLDNKPFTLNCLNGAIDLTTGQLRPHDRADLLTKRLELSYDPAATCPLWLKFLDRVMGGNSVMVEFLQRAIGYTLTGDVSEQCLFFLHGTGKNGKSVFSETVKALFGEFGQKAPTDMLMVRYGQSGIPNDVARLPGARFVIVAEVEQGRRLAESLVKDLTGGDTMIARFLRQEFFEFEPTHKLWMYGNHKPIIKGTDEGIWRRLKLIPFDVTIPESERDSQLVKKLRSELSGILAWAVQGCLAWQRQGLNPPRVVDQATNDYRAEMDALSDFLEECCLIVPPGKVKAGDLHKVYKEWCQANGEKELSRRALGQRLRERGFETAQGTSGYQYWQGIGLRADTEIWQT